MIIFTCLKYKVEIFWAGLILGIKDSDANLTQSPQNQCFTDLKKRKRGLQVVYIFDIKPTDGATIFANLRKGGKF